MKAAVGASGGVNIIAGTIEVYLNYFFLKRDPLSAVLAPRIYHQVCYFSFLFFLPNIERPCCSLLIAFSNFIFSWYQT